MIVEANEKRLLSAILRELSGGDLNTLDRFQNWSLSQEPTESLEIMKWAVDYRNAELTKTYQIATEKKSGFTHRWEKK